MSQSRSREYFAARLQRASENEARSQFATLLAGFKRREYASIMLRDLLGLSTLSEVTAEVSCLADVIIEAALRDTEQRLQRRAQTASASCRVPLSGEQGFAIISLGKLGGNELNYSSDIDLMFLYDTHDSTEAGRQGRATREYSIRLAQETTELLSRHTPEGPVFRIDLRLRPQGSQEELAVSFPHAVRYYREVAQDWELQALIKARHTAGDAALSRRFINAIEAQVYRPALNFGAIKTALQSREKIDKHRKRRTPLPESSGGLDVKLDRGGIRDIEFLVQCLQRVYGGEEPWLRSSGTLFALQKLFDKQHLSGPDYHHLNDAYVFLRTVEHRLQMRQGRQTHRLPDSPAELQLIARSMAREGSAIPDAAAFLSQVRGLMSRVSGIYARVVFHEKPPEDDRSVVGGTGPGRSLLYKQFVQDLAQEAPALTATLRNRRLGQHARGNLERFLGSASSSPATYTELLRGSRALESGLQLFELSDLLSDMLCRNPAEIVKLEGIASMPDGHDPVTAFSIEDPQRSAGRAELLSSLRKSFRQQMFVSAARDVLFLRDPYVALEEKTCIADRVIAAALRGVGAMSGFAVLALGRLGSREFDVLSDADLLFVTDEGFPREAARKIAEQLVQTLTLYTSEGSVVVVDTRLRPHGSAGELVTTPAQLKTYFAGEAQTWEALTYLRARYVAGDEDVAERSVAAVKDDLLPAVAARWKFGDELAQMRARLENSDSDANLKTSSGGVYDIDYLLGALQIVAGLPAAVNLHRRVELLEERGLLDPADARELQANALFLRSLEHAIRLVTGKPGKWLPSSEPARRSIEQLMQSSLKEAETVAARLNQTMDGNREMYARHLQTTKPVS